MKPLRTYFAITAWRILLLYLVMAACRICFYVYNYSTVGPISLAEFPKLVYGSLRFDTISIVYVFGLWIFLSLFPSRIRWTKGYRAVLFYYFIIIGGLTVVLCLSDAVYFRFTGKRLTSEEIFFASNSNTVLLILRFMADNWMLVLLGIAFIVILGFGYRRRFSPNEPNRHPIGYAVNLIVLCSVALACVASVRGGLSRMARPTSIPYATQFAASSAKANLILSNPFCIIRTWGDSSTSVPEYLTEEEMNSEFTPYRSSDKEGSHKGYNILIFVMESMSAEHSAFLSPELYSDRSTKGYTPFLDSLMAEGYCFRRMFATGKRSIQALPSVWSSIPSLKEPFMLMAESLGETRALPSIMHDQGYETAFFCGSESGSMGFDAYALSVGFEHTFSMDDYTVTHSKDDFDGYWGIWDDRFLDYMGETLSTVRQPFLASIFTLSSHHPFVVPDRALGYLPQGETKVQKCVAFVDRGFREFFEKYKDAPWFSHTLFVFVADHVSSEKMVPSTEVSPEDHHILGFMYAGDGTLKGENTDPTSQLDIMPTIIGLTGVKEPYFAFGHDAIEESDEERIVIVYDNLFKAFSKDYVYEFDGDRITGVYTVGDWGRSNNLASSVDSRNVEKRIKAYIQQYYTHVSQKSYVVPTLSANKD